MQLALEEYPSLQLANRQTVLKSLADKIYKGEIEELPSEAFDTYNSNFHSAITSGNVERAKMFKNNLSRFAAAKTNHLVKALDRARADEDGVIIDKKEYDVQATKITNAYNRYQAIEYNTAVHRNRVAIQWDQFEKEKTLYPNLEWLRTRSANPREVHLEYVGRIWSIYDQFWVENQPGCVYGCKCSVKSTDAAPTDNKELKIVSPSVGLEGNPHDTEEIITDKHPYFKGIDKHIPAKGVLMNPDDIVYINKTTKDGNKYQVHYLSLTAPETVENTKIVGSLLDYGYTDIKLLPVIHESETALRDRYFGTKYNELHPTANPDATIDGDIVEFKSSNYNNLNKRINKAAEKSNIAVIKTTEVVSEGAVKKAVKDGLYNNKNLKTIIIINDDKTNVFNR